jgi:IS30 family transposase
MDEPTTSGSGLTWLHRLDARTLFIEPGIPWENGYNENSNDKLRDELPYGDIF